MDHKEQALIRWFHAWVVNDSSAIDEVFADDVIYSECYGPEYHGVAQMKQWFADWNEKGRVLEWTIRKNYTLRNTLIAEWYFRCAYDGVVDGFNGVTIADFNSEGKIASLREFQSKAEHEFPYGT